mgnify:FL=1
MKGNYQKRDYFNPYLMDRKGVLDLISQLQSREKNTFNSLIKGCYPQLTKQKVLEDAWERLDEIEEEAEKLAEEIDKEMGGTN